MTCEVAIFGFTLRPIPYTYLVPDNLAVQPGQLVEVPFGRRKSRGMVISTSSSSESIFDLKPFTRILSAQPILSTIQLQLARWISQTYFSPLAEAIELFLPRIPKVIPPVNSSQDQELILFPTIDQAISAHNSYPSIIYGAHLPTQEFDQSWQQIHSDAAKAIVGTRSALFAPFCNLKKITIFQTESDLYKDERRPYYRTLAVAKQLATLCGAELKAISYSPRIQDQYLINHEIKKITHHFSYQVTDLKKTPIIGSALLDTLKKTPSSARTLIFLNRKSDHGSLTCQTCKQVSYTNDPSLCPNCGSSQVKFKIINLSTLSKKITDQIGPGATFSTQQIFFQSPEKNRFDIIVVLSSDTYLHHNSFNAGEKTFQMITNLIRLLSPQGKIIIQTSFPYHPSIQLALQTNYKDFYHHELNARREASYPPFTNLAKLTYRDPKSEQPPDPPRLPINIEVLGPFDGKNPYFVARGQDLKALESLTRPWVLDIDPLSI